ncbi:MAG: argininosuccinate lyase [Actinomycetia bacterium]|nr:argininosuccinate lyase [Actinomycetes bacterium]
MKEEEFRASDRARGAHDQHTSRPADVDTVRIVQAASSASEAAWGGRFESLPSEEVERFGASLPVDKRLWREDIDGSIAHARMLGRCGIITSEEAEQLIAGLTGIRADIEAGKLAPGEHIEDIHMLVESELTARVGELGGRLHTGRSRNDQVASDLRLWVKRQLSSEHLPLLCELREVLLETARSNQKVLLPGYTHMQRAQPILLAHYLSAYVQMFARDFIRFKAARDAADASALGSAALAGTSYGIDRQMTAAELGFSTVMISALDAVSDRDFVLDALYASAVCQMHLSRICEELVLWSSTEFGFVTLADSYATGSSIMPQKKNPDFAELVRGKSGRVYGDLMALLTVMKGLPLSYDKDMQEDKEPLFDALDTVADSLRILTGMLRTAHFHTSRMRSAATRGFAAATDLADYLVQRAGVPFRQAHEIMGNVVLYAVKQNRLSLEQLSLDELRAFHPAFDQEAMDLLDPRAGIALKRSEGATGPEMVALQLEASEARLAADRAELEL